MEVRGCFPFTKGNIRIRRVDYKRNIDLRVAELLSTFNGDDLSASLPFNPCAIGLLVAEERNDQHWDSVIQALLDAHHPALGDEQPGELVAKEVLLRKPGKITTLIIDCVRVNGP